MTARTNRQLAAVSVALLASVGALLAVASPARAVTGGCSVQTSPLIQSGQTQTSDAYACPDHRGYWAINLKIGDQLNVDVTPAAPSVFVEPYRFDVYGPNPGSIGDFLCQNEGAGSSRVSCLVPATGRYVLVSYGAGQFTPTVKVVRSRKGRVMGACDPTTAPAAADRVMQYANGMVCRPSGSTQYWAMRLHRGVKVRVRDLAVRSSGNAEPFDVQVYGPNPSALGRHRCGNSGLGPAYSFTCRIRRTGRYVFAVANSGSFRPVVIRPRTR